MAGDHELKRIALEKALHDETIEPIPNLPVSLLNEITRGFSGDERIGGGGFGTVYKGTLRNGVVAVKKLSPDKNTVNDFENETYCMTEGKHKNILRLLGYNSSCEGPEGSQNATDRIMLICSEYMPNGRLSDYIQDEPCRLQWSTRYAIIIGICEGLQHLHSKEGKVCIIHKDLNPSNILLDDNMVPKITDFGTSRHFTNDQSYGHTQGGGVTFGYVAPELFLYKEYTTKSDMYSLGIIMMDLLVGPTRRKELRAGSIEGRHILNEVIVLWRKVKHEQILRQVKVCAEIAIRCMDEDPTESTRDPMEGRRPPEKRPTASDIIHKLRETENPTCSSLRQISAGAELLDIHPRVLCFPFTRHEGSCLLHLTNRTKHNVIFWILPEFPEQYSPWLDPRNERVVKARETHVLNITTGPPPVIAGVFRILSVANRDGNVNELMSVIGETTFNSETMLKRIEKLSEVHETVLTAVIHPSRKPKIIQSPYPNKIRGSDKAEPVYSMDVHPKEPWILMSHGLKISIWNYRTKEIIKEVKVGKEGNKLILRKPVLVKLVKFMHGAPWIVMGDTSGQIHVISCDTWKTIEELGDHGDSIISLAVHPTQRLLVSTGGRYMFLWKWNPEGNWTRETYSDNFGKWTQIKFSTEDTFATSSESNGPIKTWSIRESRPKARLYKERRLSSQPLFGQFDYLRTASGRQYMITTTKEGACIWDLQEETASVVHNLCWENCEHIAALTCHPTLPLIFLVAQDGEFSTIYFWNYINYDRFGKINRIQKDFHEIQEIGFVHSEGIVVMYKEDRIEVLELELKTIAYQQETDSTSSVEFIGESSSNNNS